LRPKLSYTTSHPLSPFGLFISEFAILSEAFGQARFLVVGLFLAMLSVVIGGFTYHLLRLLGGEPSGAPSSSKLNPSEYTVMGGAALCLLVFGARISHLFEVLLQEAIVVMR